MLSVAICGSVLPSLWNWRLKPSNTRKPLQLAAWTWLGPWCFYANESYIMALLYRSSCFPRAHQTAWSYLRCLQLLDHGSPRHWSHPQSYVPYTRTLSGTFDHCWHLKSARLDYCNSLLHCASVRNLNRLQVAQNELATVVCRAPPNYVCDWLHWLLVRQRIVDKLALLTHKILTTWRHCSRVIQFCSRTEIFK